MKVVFCFCFFITTVLKRKTAKRSLKQTLKMEILYFTLILGVISCLIEFLKWFSMSHFPDFIGLRKKIK